VQFRFPMKSGHGPGQAAIFGRPLADLFRNISFPNHLIRPDWAKRLPALEDGADAAQALCDVC